MAGAPAFREGWESYATATAGSTGVDRGIDRLRDGRRLPIDCATERWVVEEPSGGAGGGTGAPRRRSVFLRGQRGFGPNRDQNLGWYQLCFSASRGRRVMAAGGEIGR